MKLDNLKYLTIGFNTFEGGAGAAAAAPEGAATTQEGTGDQAYDPKNAVYGKSAEAVKDETTTQTRVDLTPDEQFDQLIKGEHKGSFDKKVQNIINTRFKHTKELESKVGQLEPLADLMMQHLGVESLDDLSEKLQTDIIEKEAYEKDIPVDEYRRMKETERENKQLKAFKDEQMRKADADKKVASWFAQEPDVQKDYPEFKMENELKNKDFVSLLHHGVNAKTAYEVLHINDIKTGVAQQTESAVVQNIHARGHRPKENGTKTKRGVVAKRDVSSLTKADRAEVARRSSRGERISF